MLCSCCGHAVPYICRVPLGAGACKDSSSQCSSVMHAVPCRAHLARLLLEWGTARIRLPTSQFVQMPPSQTVVRTFTPTLPTEPHTHMYACACACCIYPQARKCAISSRTVFVRSLVASYAVPPRLPHFFLYRVLLLGPRVLRVYSVPMVRRTHGRTLHALWTLNRRSSSVHAPWQTISRVAWKGVDDDHVGVCIWVCGAGPSGWCATSACSCYGQKFGTKAGCEQDLCTRLGSKDPSCCPATPAPPATTVTTVKSAASTGTDVCSTVIRYAPRHWRHHPPLHLHHCVAPRGKINCQAPSCVPVHHTTDAGALPGTQLCSCAPYH